MNRPPYEYGGSFESRMNAALLVAFMNALAERRKEELGDRAQAFLSSVAASDPEGAARIRMSMETLVRALAPWIRGNAGASADGSEVESAISIIDPEKYDGVHYELDLVSGPELAAMVEDLKNRGRHLLRGAQPPTRSVFDGPPGCGKTQAAFWIARQLGMKVAVVMLAKLISKWVGETGARFLKSIDEAREAGALLLVDELDAVGSHRTEGQHGAAVHAAQVVGAVNQALDDPKNQNLIVIGATNLPDMIDPSIARRFKTRVRFGFPDAATRERIARHCWRFAPVQPEALAALIARTEERSGDVVVRACDAANRAAGRRGGARVDAVQKDADLESLLRATIDGDGNFPTALGLKVVGAIQSLDEGRRIESRVIEDLIVCCERIDVNDVVSALSCLAKEVQLDRAPSLILRPGDSAMRRTSP